MMRRTIWAFVVGIAVAAFGTEAVAARHGSHPEISSASQWDDLLPTDSRVSIVGEDPVTARRSQINEGQQIYSEAMQLDGGRILYELRQGASVQKNEAVEAELFNRYSSQEEIRALGVTIDRQAIRKISSDNGDIAVISADSPTYHCVFFFQYAGGDAGKGSQQSQALTGGRCLDVSDPDSPRLEAKLRDLLSRVRYDNGTYARSQLFAGGLDDARRQMILDEAQISQDKTPPQIDVPSSLKTNGSELIVRGRAIANVELAQLQVNGKWVTAEPDGHFTAKVQVPAGDSQVTVVAISGANIRTEKVIAVSNAGQGPSQVVPVGLPQFGRYYALIIAEQHYLDTRLELDTPIADGRAVGAVLQKKYGFEVRYLEDAHKDDILKAFQDYARQLNPADNLLVYYAGHGVFDERSAGKPAYWVPVDGNGGSAANWLPNRNIIRALRMVKAAHVMLVSDSCFSGTFTGERDLVASSTKRSVALVESIDTRSRTALSSGGIEQVVDVFRPDDKNSVFATHLVSVLSRNPGVMSGTQISSLVRGMVRRQVPQTPQYGAILSAGHDGDGDFFFNSEM